jgi:hypothetical protein
MQNLRAQEDALFAKILTKAQIERLGQIELRRRGPTAILQDVSQRNRLEQMAERTGEPAVPPKNDLVAKLNIGPEQQAELTSIQDQGNQMRRDLFVSMRQNMQQFIGPDGQPDRNAMRAYRDSAEGKAQQEQMTKQNDTLQNQMIAAMGKILTKKQKSKFDSMLGKPFDVSKLNNGPGGPGGPGGPPAATDAAPTDGSAPADTAKATPAKKGTRKTTSKKKSA